MNVLPDVEHTFLLLFFQILSNTENLNMPHWTYFFLKKISRVLKYYCSAFLQCFDAVGSVAGRASGL